jgi:diguanylate cyclase (GGDEF)-like protein
MIDRRGSADRRLARLAEANTRLRRRLAEQESFWRIAHQDPLTGLWNRRYADDRLAEEMARTENAAGYQFSLLVADVDDLKRINDRYGHASGDQALRWVAKILKQGLRSDDVCCRIGGDEFLLILPACGAEACRRFVARLRTRCQLAARAQRRAGVESVGVSVGTASFPSDGRSVEALCAAADAAMYAEKGRSRQPGAVPQPRRLGTESL